MARKPQASLYQKYPGSVTERNTTVPGRRISAIRNYEGAVEREILIGLAVRSRSTAA